MAQKDTKTTVEKKAPVKKGTTAKATPKKAAKPRVSKPPKEDLVVFAFRLTEAERTTIHETAGPRNATQFVRRVVIAFADEDEAAFTAVLKDAREARSA